MKIVFWLVPVLLAACAHSGVVAIGPDSYMVAYSEWGFTSGGVQKAKAMKEASDFCNRTGKQFLPIGTTQNDATIGQLATAEVQFRCLRPDAPEFQKN